MSFNFYELYVSDSATYYVYLSEICKTHTVARVLHLACTNEYLLRTMDSLVAVQWYIGLKAITEIKTKFKHSWSKNSRK